MFLILLFKFFKKFIYFDRERASGKEQNEGERENPTVSAEPDVGLELTNREIMT